MVGKSTLLYDLSEVQREILGLPSNVRTPSEQQKQQSAEVPQCANCHPEYRAAD